LNGGPELDQDIGGLAGLPCLEAVRDQLAARIAVLQVERARRDAGIEVRRPAWKNLVFTGDPGVKYNQKPLLAFLAAKHHLSIFPFSSQVVDAVRDRLAAFELSKGTIRFTAATPLPDEIVRDIVRHRIQEIAGPAR
jgi:uncharacterized protein YdhG (YjbR/CyaY superfamily)